jgi:hypothetical protein
VQNGLNGFLCAAVLASTMATVACSSNSSGAGTGGGVGTGGTASAAGGGSSTGGLKSAGGSGAATGGSGAATGGGSSCPNVTPCGGNVVGTWSVTSSCLTVSGALDLTPLGISCTTGSVTGSFHVTGTWVANSDGTYSDNTTTSGSGQLELPAECHNVSGTTTTCVDLARGIPNLGYTSGTCSDNTATGGCTCPVTAAQDGWMGTIAPTASTGDMYTVANNVITVSDGRNHTTPYGYCISTNTMTVSPQGTKYGTVAGTIVLQKQ